MLIEAKKLLKLTHPGGRGVEVQEQSQCLTASFFDNNSKVKHGTPTVCQAFCWELEVRREMEVECFTKHLLSDHLGIYKAVSVESQNDQAKWIILSFLFR